MVPEQTITRVLNPPSTNTETKSYTVAGVNPSDTSTGLITTAQIVTGKWFGAQPADEILVNTAYASTNDIKVGQQLTIDKTVFTVVGLVNPTLTGNTSDIYFDLSTLQTLGSNTGRVNEVLVKVAKSSDVSAVATAIHKELPGAQVLTNEQLSGQVTGSLSNAHTLGHPSGRGPGRDRVAGRLPHRRATHLVERRQAGARDRHASRHRLVTGSGRPPDRGRDRRDRHTGRNPRCGPRCRGVRHHRRRWARAELDELR